MNTREQVIKKFREDSRKSELLQAKQMAKSKLSNLDNSEKETLSVLKQLVDKAGITTVRRMLTLLDTIEAE